MKTCLYCGSYLDERASYCQYCGAAQNPGGSAYNNNYGQQPQNYGGGQTADNNYGQPQNNYNRPNNRPQQNNYYGPPPVCGPQNNYPNQDYGQYNQNRPPQYGCGQPPRPSYPPNYNPQNNNGYAPQRNDRQPDRQPATVGDVKKVAEKASSHRRNLAALLLCLFVPLPVYEFVRRHPFRGVLKTLLLFAAVIMLAIAPEVGYYRYYSACPDVYYEYKYEMEPVYEGSIVGITVKTAALESIALENLENVVTYYNGGVSYAKLYYQLNYDFSDSYYDYYYNYKYYNVSFSLSPIGAYQASRVGIEVQPGDWLFPYNDYNDYGAQYKYTVDFSYVVTTEVIPGSIDENGVIISWPAVEETLTIETDENGYPVITLENPMCVPVYESYYSSTNCGGSYYYNEYYDTLVGLGTTILIALSIWRFVSFICIIVKLSRD